MISLNAFVSLKHFSILTCNNYFIIPAISCHSLPKPQFGIILPPKCVVEKSFVGDRCILHCSPGYILSNKRIAVCQKNQTWSITESYDCVRNYNPEIFIKCPQNTTIMLTTEQKEIFVRLERPRSNVNQLQVKVFPTWARNLDLHLDLGVHKINFRAYTEDFTKFVSCTTIINVKSLEPPRNVFCPQSIEIILGMHEYGRTVVWKEPIFEDNNSIKKIYKSKVSIYIFDTHS